MSVTKGPVRRELYPMREACRNCGCDDWGFHNYIKGQHVISCGACDTWVYNAPKREYEGRQGTDAMHNATHWVYRLYDAEGKLLYIGETNDRIRRMKQHEKEKSWFGDVRDIRYETFASPEEAKAAEKAAIQSEYPVHNIVHAHGPATRPDWDPCSNHYGEVREWVVPSLRSDYERRTSLWLYPEIDYSSVLCDFEGKDPADALRFYVDYMMNDDERWELMKSDRVTVSWFVMGDRFCEPVLFAGMPVKIKTYGDYWGGARCPDCGFKLNIERLPVINSRFPELAKALGRMPVPFDRYYPLWSVVMGSGDQ